MQPVRTVDIQGHFAVGGNRRFAFFAGPCAIESREMVLETASRLKEICAELDVDLVFKASFDKANRSSSKNARGVGMEAGLCILQEVKDTFGLPILTDVHEAWQCAPVAEVVDILQIPAFLCRQTDLLVAAAQTGKAVNVKKGQFLAPWDMRNVIDKLRNAGNERILLCERGTTFGYNNLVVDMTGLVEMRRLGYPVVFDATHSVQKPGGQGTSTGGNRAMVPYLMRAALAVGVDAIFAEVHPNPEVAISDAANQLYLSQVKEILSQAIAIDDLVKQSFGDLDASEPVIVNAPEIPQPDFSGIKLFLSDVDGVLTDAGMYYAESGDELKKFNAHDGMGMQLLRKHGIKTGIVTSENTHLVEKRAKKLDLDYWVQGQRNEGKLEAVRKICAQENITLSEVAYVGDDVNCLEILSAVGIAACPADAVASVKALPNIIRLSKKGGQGCVREFTDMILSRL